MRSDMRAAANSLWLKRLEAGADPPELLYPYFEVVGDMADRMKLLDAKLAEMKANASK